MTTSYGLNPSFANYLSRLPLFANAVRRGNRKQPAKSKVVKVGQR